MLDLLDGLILAGGNDIDPAALRRRPPHPETRNIVPERDRSELALARRAVERDMPVLGICRGMQVINVAFGGTLRQHLPDELGHERAPRATPAASRTPTTTCASPPARWPRGPPARSCTTPSPTTTRASTTVGERSRW